MNDLLTLFSDGGLVMIPLLCLSLVIWAIITFRYVQLRSLSGNPYDLACHVVRTYQAGGTEACTVYLQEQKGWLAARLAAWIQGKGNQPISGIMMELREQVHEPTGSVLRALLQVAPLLGLLGTVAGMMETFDVLSTMGIASPAPLSGGIAQALITTQAGLSIALAGILGTSLLERAARSRTSAVDRATLVLSSLKEVLP